MAQAYKNISLPCALDVYDKITEAAHLEGMSKSGFCQKVLIEYINKKQQKTSTRGE